MDNTEELQLVVDHVSYTYSEKTAYEKEALNDINLVIKKGQFIGLIGHTGSGKSTLIQQLNGLIRPTKGTVYYNGWDIYDADFSRKDLRTKVGLVFQYPEHQLFETTVEKDVEFGPKNKKMPQLEVQLNTYEALKMVGISDDLLDVSPFDLSGGQKRRVAIAGVLAMKPEVLILDEPTAGLDPRGRDEILDNIAKIHKEQGITVILVSHSMEDVAKYVDRLIVMDHGRIRYDGTPKEVFANYDELEKLGLAAPQVTYLTESLRQEGMPIRGLPTTIKEAKEEILRCLSDK